MARIVPAVHDKPSCGNAGAMLPTSSASKAMNNFQVCPVLFIIEWFSMARSL